MLDIISFITGSAITLITMWFQGKEKKKYFELEVKEKLKLVAVEKRLEAHQEAFKYWHRLFTVIHKPDDDAVKIRAIDEAYEFWEGNALYLEERTRKDFREMIHIISFYYFAVNNAKDEQDQVLKERAREDFLKDWNFVLDVSKTIQQEVYLEAIRPSLQFDPEGNELKKGGRIEGLKD